LNKSSNQMTTELQELVINFIQLIESILICNASKFFGSAEDSLAQARTMLGKIYSF